MKYQTLSIFRDVFPSNDCRKSLLLKILSGLGCPWKAVNLQAFSTVFQGLLEVP